MAVGILTGSGSHSLPGFEAAKALQVETPFGQVEVQRGHLGGVEVLQISRHGAGHVRLSNHVNHRANVWALKSLEATAVIGCTACGAVDDSLQLGQLVVFDDLWFLGNRLPDGSLCTMFVQEGAPERGHWILHGGPYSPDVRAALVAGGADAELTVRDGGCYGHVDGPRFNTPAEIAGLAAAGVVAVSQTGGPETVLCGEMELPYALVGFITDYANEVRPGATTPVDVLIGLLGSSSAAFGDLLGAALPRLAATGSASDPAAGGSGPLPGQQPEAAGTVYRFGP